MDDLDLLFEQARQTSVTPSDALMARVLTDAEKTQPVPRVLVPTPKPKRKPGFWQQLTHALGGGGVFAGVTVSMVLGLFVGLVQPSGLSSLSDTLWLDSSFETVDLMPGIDALLAEE